MSTQTQAAVRPCPVAAIIPDLARVLTLQADIWAATRAGDEHDGHREAVLRDREIALTRVAGTSRSSSLIGAAMQVLLAFDAAAEMGAIVVPLNLKVDTSIGIRTGAELDRTAEATARAAYAAIAAAGGELPQVIVERYMPLESDVWNDLTATGEALPKN